MSNIFTLYCIAFQGSRDQPSAHGFTKYIRQPSPAAGKVAVVAMGAVATATAIAQRIVPASPAQTTGSLPRILHLVVHNSRKYTKLNNRDTYSNMP